MYVFAVLYIMPIHQCPEYCEDCIHEPHIILVYLLSGITLNPSLDIENQAINHL